MSHFGYEDWILVLIVPDAGHCSHCTFTIAHSLIYVLSKRFVFFLKQQFSFSREFEVRKIRASYNQTVHQALPSLLDHKVLLSFIFYTNKRQNWA